MLKQIKSALLRLSNHVASLFGFEIVRKGSAAPAVHWVLTMGALKQRGFSPRHCIDVGANRGDWTRCVSRMFPNAEFTLIEPQPQLRSKVSDLENNGIKLRWITAGASDQAGTMMLSSDGRDHSATFMPSAMEAERAGMSQVEVQVRTINEILETEKLQVPDVIKIDAEGLDLKVFAGASNCWGKTELFLLEAVVCAREFAFTTTVLEVTRQLDAAGYELMDITDVNRSPANGLLWLVELVFIRKNSPLLEGVKTYLGN